MDAQTPSPPLVISSRLYTPFQVRLAAFLGGPFAAVYTLHSNFKVLGKDREKRLTLYWGIGFIIALCALLPFLPDKFPNIVIPLAYSIAAGGIAASKQLSKEAILASQIYIRHSGWKITIVCVVSIAAFCAIIFPLLFALDHFGLLHLEE